MFPIFAGNSASTGYNLTRSLRFRASASASLSKTPAASNRQIWTWSGWVKRGQLGAYQQIFGAYIGSGSTDTNYFELSFSSTDFIQATGYSTIYRRTSAVYRDPSAWYHIVVALDTTQATGSNRIKVYVNGSQVTAFGTSNDPTQNSNLGINGNYPHGIGAVPANTSYLDGYLTEVNFIDGQALTPSSFGSTNALTGVWQPAAYTGSYGTNGFYLPFTDNSALTTASNVGLGKDFSGNANYWVTNNISITAGVTYDSMTDVPTLTSATAANFAVGNPLAAQLASSWNIATMQAGNLNWGSAADNQNKVGMATMSMTSGKYYWEITIGSNFPASSTFLGITKENQQSVSKSTGVYYRNDGQKVIDSTSSAYGASYTSGDVIGLAYDATAGTLVCYKNNSSQGTLYSSGTGFSWIPTMSCDNAGSGVTYFNNVNFGQRPFTYTAPTGFVALNTYNLPTSTIVKGNTVMDVLTWSGTGGIASATRSLTGLNFKPDFVWEKDRASTQDHHLFDSVRGAGLSRTLASNSTAAEGGFNDTLYGYLSSFDSNGVTTTNGSSTWDNWNKSGDTYVAWAWQAGQGSTSSNTNGSITSTVSVNASAGFSVATFTRTAAATDTAGHGLGVKPAMVIIKARSTTSNWNVWHQALDANPDNFYILLDSTAGKASSGSWCVPTSSVVGVTNFSNGTTAVMYSWAQIAGFSAFGSYTGNGSADGPFVYTGFRPKFVMVKRTDAAESWILHDTSRSIYNVANLKLSPNNSNAESTSTYADILSNGFKLRTSSGGEGNDSGGTYIYMAFAENPLKNSLAR